MRKGVGHLPNEERCGPLAKLRRAWAKMRKGVGHLPNEEGRGPLACRSGEGDRGGEGGDQGGLACIKEHSGESGRVAPVTAQSAR